MRTRNVLALAAVVLLSVPAFAADLTVDEILAKNIEAKGGKEKLEALKSLRFSGKMALGGGMEAPFTMTKARPHQMRLEFTIQGMTGTQAYDGTTGWTVMPFMGKKDPEVMSEEMIKQVKDEADFDGPLVDYAAKGNKVDLVGKEDVEGTPAWKLKVTSKEGNETFIFLDADSFLEIKASAKRKFQGQEIEGETTFGNYQEVDGMLFPYSIEMKAKGAPGGQTITIEKVELNPAIADGAFTMPKVSAPAEAAKQ